MKRTVLLIGFISLCTLAGGQAYQKDRINPSMLKVSAESTRTEIILPEVNGFKVIKADLHVHTSYSDGSTTPSFRVIEGWRSGLDAIAITDHIEYRPNDSDMQEFLADEIIVKDNRDKSLMPDLNFSVRNAEAKARYYGITLIQGIEITRDPVNTGHFNALFTTDNNLIPDPDPLQAIRNAKKQGAIVQNNHPGWRRTDNSFTEITEAAIREGLIDGVEVFNSTEFYPDVIEEAVKRKLYICGGSDIHQTYQENSGYYRDMTLILAEDASPESIREALANQRTLAYAYGEIAGSEELLKDFFTASFDFKVITAETNGRKRVKITNKTSFSYTLALPGMTVDTPIGAFRSVMYTVEGDAMPVTVCNMWYGADKHPEILIQCK